MQDEWEIPIKKNKLMGWKDTITQVPLQQPPWEANSCYSGQEIPHLSRHPNVFLKTKPIQYKTSHAITLRRILILFLHQYLSFSELNNSSWVYNLPQPPSQQVDL